MSVAQKDIDAITLQLNRTPRGLIEVSKRCECGNPKVVSTKPELEDGKPFPTHICNTFFI